MSNPPFHDTAAPAAPTGSAASGSGAVYSPTPPGAPSPSVPLPAGGAAQPSAARQAGTSAGYWATSTLVGSKRPLSGKFAHLLDNGKAVRNEDQAHPPALELSQAWDTDVRARQRRILVEGGRYMDPTVRSGSRRGPHGQRPTSVAQFNYQGPLMRNALINVPHVPPPIMPPSGLPPPQGPAATDFYPPFTSQFPAPSRPVSPHTQLLESMAGMQFEAGNLSQNGAPDDVQMQPSGSQPLVVTGPIPPPTQAEYPQAALESVNPDVIRIVRLVNSILAPEEPPLSNEQAAYTWLRMDETKKAMLFQYYQAALDDLERSQLQPLFAASRAEARHGLQQGQPARSSTNVNEDVFHPQPLPAFPHAIPEYDMDTNEPAAPCRPQGWSAPTGHQEPDATQVKSLTFVQYTPDNSGHLSQSTIGSSTDTRPSSQATVRQSSFASVSESFSSTAALPFRDGLDLPIDKGKGRAMEVDSADQREDGQHEQTHHVTVTDIGELPIVPPPERTLNARPHRPDQEQETGGSQPIQGDAGVYWIGQIQNLTYAVQDQGQELRKIREALETRPQPEVAPQPARPQRGGESSESLRERKMNGETPRLQLREHRVREKALRQCGKGGKAERRVENDDAAEDADDEMGEEVEMDARTENEHMNRLKSRIRRTFEEMLEVVDWKAVSIQYPALTEADLEAYKRRDPEIVPTARRFRVDFAPKHGWHTFSFNKEARRVFVDRFIERSLGGAWLKAPTPKSMLQRSVIEDILAEHMRYCRKRWRESDKPVDPKRAAEIARQVCKNSRKHTLLESREVTCVRRQYTQHRALFRLLEAANMSGDETDGPEKTHPPVWRILIAMWQSRALREFFWAIDRMYREDWAKRRKGGNPPRVRILREGHHEEGVAPSGLWRNCYDPEWLQQQPPYIIDELEILDEDYDFTL